MMKKEYIKPTAKYHAFMLVENMLSTSDLNGYEEGDGLSKQTGTGGGSSMWDYFDNEE